MPSHRKVPVVIIVLAAVIILAASVLITAQQRVGAEGDSSLRKALEVMALIKLHYVEPVSVLDLVQNYVATGTIQGMMRAVKDPYSRYLTADSFNEMQIDTSGEFGGIGIYMGMRNDRITVISPIDGTPAARAGIKAGDIIVRIDGKSTEGMTPDEAANLMRGPEGTEVVIGIERGSEPEYLEFNLVRETIHVPSVEGKMLEDGIGYIRIASFTGTTVSGLYEKLHELEKQGMKGLILDLRFNPGGLLTAAIDVVDEFVTGGPILHVAGRGGQGKRTFYATSEAEYPDLPLVVLVNKGSASASEIVAGAFKDLNRATLIGTQTFGKGAVQTIFPLYDESGLVLTTQKWYTSGGHSIHLQGIEPNIVLYNPGDEEMEEHLKQMQKEQQEEAEHPERQRERQEESEYQEEIEDAKEERVEEERVEEEEPFQDLQLEKAIEVLQAKLQTEQDKAA
ncbi:MAG: S41 family peptidase [Firmicutes bacterium]|nr:S41 family peptidase [Bacillota bacterium]